MGDFNTQAAEELFNGAQSIRVRTGPGQAILPHSVAERVRRSSIYFYVKHFHHSKPIFECKAF